MRRPKRFRPLRERVNAQTRRPKLLLMEHRWRDRAQLNLCPMAECIWYCAKETKGSRSMLRDAVSSLWLEQVKWGTPATVARRDPRNGKALTGSRSPRMARFTYRVRKGT